MTADVRVVSIDANRDQATIAIGARVYTIAIDWDIGPGGTGVMPFWPATPESQQPGDIDDAELTELLNDWWSEECRSRYA